MDGRRIAQGAQGVKYDIVCRLTNGARCDKIADMNRKIPELERFAKLAIGDGMPPNLYFVTDEGVIVTITRSRELAYRHWRELSKRRPMVESAMEDRLNGVLASVEPESDEPNARLVVSDDVPTMKD